MSTGKQAYRQHVWDRMTAERVVGFPGAQGRIPNFVGAGEAATRLADLEAWITAGTLKANPDMPQLPVRARALADGKVVHMAVPKLAQPDPFITLDPDRLEVTPRKAASIRGSAVHGQPTALDGLDHIDLIVCGTVAVNRDGVRIGKGGGYSDIEFALGLETGVVDDDTVIVTTVHPFQVLDEELPETEHDFRVDLVVTPDEVIECPRVERPLGIIWADLDDERIDAIPVLRNRRP